MGCSNSKEKSTKPPVAPAVAKPKAPVTPEVAVNKPPVAEADPSTLAKDHETPQGKNLLSGGTGKNTYVFNKCTVDGEVSSFFPPKGLCYRLVRDGTWYFYNDTLNYKMLVSYTFSPEAGIAPCSQTTTTQNENGWNVVSAVVYPLETIEFVSGATDMYKTEVSAELLSEEFYKTLRPLSAAAEDELLQLRNLVPDSSDDETRLRRCVETKTPFVDLSFAPSEGILSRNGIDCRRIPAVEFRRPREYLESNSSNTKDEEIDVFRGAVAPQSIGIGILGDNWLMCAAAILAEDEGRLKELFSPCVPEEKSVGAYRVQLNSNGWWNTVLVDDFLPTVNGVPCFARVADDPRELWVSLLQKAYAKLYGSYASITGGDASHALRDFTGAPSCRYDGVWNDAKVTNSSLVIDALECHIEAGHIVLLNTPVSGGICVDMGLREGFTYYLESVHRVPSAGVTLLKMRNPWDPATPWCGAWSADSSEWRNKSDVRESCSPDFTKRDGTFWVEWNEAVKCFDGCAAVFTSRKPVYDHRVRGEFYNVHPNVVFMVHAVEPVEVVLTLTQRDKRGVAVTDPNAYLAPIMLSVSRGDGNKQRVVQCTSSDIETTSDVYNFTVSREVAMTYTFEPSSTPYFVIPRIHRKGTSEGCLREFVLGIRSTTPLEGKLDVQMTMIESSNCVFKNYLTFVVEDTSEVICPMQIKAPGETVALQTCSKVSNADYSPAAESEEIPTPTAMATAPDGDEEVEEKQDLEELDKEEVAKLLEEQKLQLHSASDVDKKTGEHEEAYINGDVEVEDGAQKSKQEL